MDGNTIGTLAEYIAELRLRNRKDNGTSGQPTINNKTENDTRGKDRDGSGDAGRDQHS